MSRRYGLFRHPPLPKVKRILAASRWFCGTTSVGSWAERLPARLLSPHASLLGCPPIGLSTEWISRGTQIDGKPYILGLNAAALRPKFGNDTGARCARIISPRAARRLHHRGILQRETGYISQATPTPISTNSANDHSAYLTPPELVRCVRHASTSETSSANSSRAPKWLRRSARLSTMSAPQIN
jgi:hypothetical protein